MRQTVVFNMVLVCFLELDFCPTFVHAKKENYFAFSQLNQKDKEIVLYL